jgi:SAM-dependent methyltransferase
VREGEREMQTERSETEKRDIEMSTEANHLSSPLSRLSEDIVIDVGCGDGRVLVEAARSRGARCIGIDLFEDRVAETLQAAKDAGVADLISAYCVDAREWDGWEQGSVIILCLLPKALKMFRPKIEECIARGARVITYLFDVEGLEPFERDEMYSLRLYKRRGEGSGEGAEGGGGER